MKLRLTSLAPIAALVLLSACNQTGKTDKAAPAEPAKPPVATVDGAAVSADMFDLFVHSQTGKKTEELTAEQKKEALDGLVRLIVASKVAEKDGLEKEPDTKARIDLVRMNLLAEALAQKFLKDKTPTDQDLQAEYDRQVAGMPKSEFKARHILVADEDTAKKVIAALDKGAKFADLAKAQSQDSSKAQGGDLGWFSTGQMVKPFADAVQTLAKGQYTKTPVQTQFGWHVILLEDSRPTVAPPFDAVKDRLGPLVQQRKVRDYVDGLVKTAKVESKL